MKQMGFYFDQTRCTGCYTCAVACKDWHDIPAGQVNWMRVQPVEHGKFPKPFLAYLCSPCYQCANPPCVLACPAKAISKRKSDGIVVVDREKCLGNQKCKQLCRNACPWKAPQFGAEENAKMQKCDLCLERLQQGKKPICVEACPTYALDTAPLEKLQQKYGNATQAAEFRYSPRFRPSVVFRPKPED